MSQLILILVWPGREAGRFSAKPPSAPLRSVTRLAPPLAAVIAVALLSLSACLQAQPLSSLTPAPVFKEDQPVTLAQAIQVARQRQGSVAAAQQNVLASQQVVTQVRTGTLPSITGDVGYTVNGSVQRFGQAGQLGSFQTNSSNTGIQPAINLGYTVFDGGLTAASVRQAQANVAGSAAGLGTVRNNLAYTVATDYLNQLKASHLLDLQREQEKLAQEQLNSVDAQIRVGSAPAADRALPLSQLRNQQVAVVQAQNNLVIAASTLRDAMGLPVGSALNLVEPSTTPPAKIPSVAELTAEASRQRPEVAQAQAQLKAAQESISIARINRAPRVNADLSYGLTPNNDLTHQQWLAGLDVSMPLWDAGLTRAKEAEASAQAKAAQAQLEQTQKDVAAQAEQAFNNLQSSIQSLDASRLAVDAAKVNLDSTTERYNLGASGVDVISLITAQTQYAVARNDEIQATYNVELSQAQLDQALGRQQ